MLRYLILGLLLSGMIARANEIEKNGCTVIYIGSGGTEEPGFIRGSLQCGVSVEGIHRFIVKDQDVKAVLLAAMAGNKKVRVFGKIQEQEVSKKILILEAGMQSYN